MSSEQALNEMVYQLQYLRAASESIQQRIGLVEASLDELRMALSTLEGIYSEAAGCSMLVPIGGGSYIRARLDDPEKLIVGVGADVSVEKTINEAKEDFNSRALELEKARASLQQQFEEVSTRMNGIQREAQKIAQSRGEAKNV